VGGIASFSNVILGGTGTKTLTATDGILQSVSSSPIAVS
jgi:hypothetical protein